MNYYYRAVWVLHGITGCPAPAKRLWFNSDDDLFWSSSVFSMSPLSLDTFFGLVEETQSMYNLHTERSQDLLILRRHCYPSPPTQPHVSFDSYCYRFLSRFSFSRLHEETHPAWTCLGLHFKVTLQQSKSPNPVLHHSRAPLKLLTGERQSTKPMFCYCV